MKPLITLFFFFCATSLLLNSLVGATHTSTTTEWNMGKAWWAWLRMGEGCIWRSSRVSE